MVDKPRSRLPSFVAYARYTVHPCDKLQLIEAINLYRAQVTAAPGYLYFYFSWAKADANTCVLSEGWVGKAAIDRQLGIEPLENELKTKIECLKITGTRTTFSR